MRALARDGLFPGPAPAVAREPSGLAPAEREVARAAAVLGDVFHPAQAAAVAGYDLPRALTALDALAERGVIRAAPGAVPLLRFRHPLLRAVLHARMPPGARIAAHARAARVLRAAGADPVDRAPHLARSAAPGDLPAVRTLAEAAHRVLDTHPARAAQWLHAARRILPGDADTTVRRRILHALWHAAERTGDHRLRGDLLPEIEDLADPVAGLALHARLATDLGRHRQAGDLLRTALRTADETEAADLRRQLAVLAAARGRLPAVRTLLADDTGPDAAAVLALAGALAGDDAAYRAGAARATPVLADLTPADLARRQHTVVRLGWAANLAERYPAAAELFGRGVRAARETGWTGLLPRLLFGHGYALLALGRTGEALRSLEDAEAAADDQDRGDLARLARMLRTSALAWRDGPAPSVAGAPAADGAERLWWAVLAPATPVAPAASAVPAAGDALPVRPGPSTPGRRATALCARASGASDADAVPLLSEAAAGFADRGMALWESHARLLLARRLAALDRLTEATAEAGRAKALAVAAGSTWLRGLAVDRQRAIGARMPRQSAAAPGAGLSVREAEIVRMVRAGKSNRDIAAALFVSVKTVEAHLTRIFRKTGARSRTALAAAPPLPVAGADLRRGGPAR